MSTIKDVDKKLDTVLDRMGKMDTTMVRQQVILDEHVKRSNAIEETIKPLQKHVNMMDGAFKFISLMAVIATIVEAIHLIFK